MKNITVTACPACQGKDFKPYLQVADYRASKEVFELIQCVHCGLVITQHHPALIDIGRYYETEDYISHSDKALSIMDRVYYFVRKVMVRSKRAVVTKHSIGKRLIDIGSGSGFFAAHMQRHGWDVRGMEPSPQARQVALDSHGLKLEEPDALFKTEAQSADVVTMWHVLEHVHTPQQYLQQIHKTLSDQGVLFLALPNYKSYDARYYGKFWAAWDVPRHLWHFSTDAVKEILKNNGFEVIISYAMPLDVFYVALLSEKYRGGNFLRMLRAIGIGKISFANAILNEELASSVIYVCRKEEGITNKSITNYEEEIDEVEEVEE